MLTKSKHGKTLQIVNKEMVCKQFQNEKKMSLHLMFSY